MGLFKSKKLFNGRGYDFVASLGDNCATAAYLKRFGMREMSGPFDWNGGPVDGLSHYAHFLETNFADFLVRENLVKDENKLGPKDIKGRDYYHDRVTNYHFMHDFRYGSNFAEEFELVRQKYARRIERFMNRMAAGGRILLVHVAKCVPTDVATATEALKRIRAVFGNDKIDLLVFIDDHSEKDLRVETFPDGLAVATCDCFSARHENFMGNVPVMSRVFAQINYRHRFRTAFRAWWMKTRTHLVAAFILDSKKRKSYRSHHGGGHD